MEYQHLPLKDMAIDIALFIGTILAIFTFGLAALPMVKLT